MSDIPDIRDCYSGEILYQLSASGGPIGPVRRFAGDRNMTDRIFKAVRHAPFSFDPSEELPDTPTFAKVRFRAMSTKVVTIVVYEANVCDVDLPMEKQS